MTEQPELGFEPGQSREDVQNEIGAHQLARASTALQPRSRSGTSALEVQGDGQGRAVVLPRDRASLLGRLATALAARSCTARLELWRPTPGELWRVQGREPARILRSQRFR